MRQINIISVVLLVMLGGCSGAYVSMPVGPVTIGTDISMFGDSSHDRVDEVETDESARRVERE